MPASPSPAVAVANRWTGGGRGQRKIASATTHAGRADRHQSPTPSAVRRPPQLLRSRSSATATKTEARVALCTCFLKSNVLGGFAFIGEGIPVATGAAFSSKYRREVYKEDCDHVTLAFFGDGTCNNGQFYECLNMAALWKLPIVFVVENNLWAIGMSHLRATSDPEIWKKGPAFGMPGVHVDGMDVLRATTLASLSLVDYSEFIQTSP
nr:collinsiaXII-like protein [Ipomoea batatas]